jgi:thiamine biosynthesis lipoprotein
MRDLAVGGCTVSHTLSPVTGRPVTQVRHAVVKAPTAEAADALATAFMAMPTARALALADRMDGVEALIADRDGVRRGSAGWGDLVDRAPRPALIRTAAAAAIGADIAYQVPKIEASPYHAPYVVMWITDENRQLVRTLMVLGTKPRWVPENYIWWRRYGRQMGRPLDSIARPTRLPGRYALHWDGLDEAGKPAAPGRYILHIEAAREKGGHTYQTVDLDLTGAGSRSLAAKDEMGAVDVRYGPAK